MPGATTQTSPAASVELARPIVAHAVPGLRPVFESFPDGDTYRTTACAGAVSNERAIATTTARPGPRRRHGAWRDANGEMFTWTSCAGGESARWRSVRDVPPGCLGLGRSGGAGSIARVPPYRGCSRIGISPNHGGRTTTSAVAAWPDAIRNQRRMLGSWRPFRSLRRVRPRPCLSATGKLPGHGTPDTPPQASSSHRCCARARVRISSTSDDKGL